MHAPMSRLTLAEQPHSFVRCLISSFQIHLYRNACLMDAQMRSDLRTLQHFSEEDPKTHEMHTHPSEDQANYTRMTELA